MSENGNGDYDPHDVLDNVHTQLTELREALGVKAHSQEAARELIGRIIDSFPPEFNEPADDENGDADEPEPEPEPERQRAPRKRTKRQAKRAAKKR